MISTGWKFLLSAFLSSALLHPVNSQPEHYVVQSIDIDDSDEPDYFGRGLDFSGATTMAVGAPGKVVNGRPDAGAVYLYGKDETPPIGQQWCLQTTVVEPSETNESFFHFGDAVTIEGGTLIVRAYEVSTNDTYILLFGHVDSEWIFTRSIFVEEWNGLSIRIRYQEGEWPLELTESTLVFTAGRGASATVRVYVHTGPGIVDTEQILVPDDVPNFRGSAFGRALVVKDDSVVVSSPNEIGNENGQGAIYLFKKQPDGTYARHQRIAEDEFDYGMGLWMAIDHYQVIVTRFDYDNLNMEVRVFSIETGDLVVLKDTFASTGDLDLACFLALSDGVMGYVNQGYPFDYRAFFRRIDGPGRRLGGEDPPDIDRLSMLGISIAMEENIAAVGSVILYDTQFRGAVHMYEYLDEPPPEPTPAPTMLDTALPFSVQKFVLFDAVTDKRITSLKDGDIFDRRTIGRSVNIKAVTDGPVESVAFELNGVEYSTDDAFPYALGGDNPRGDYRRVPELAVADTYTVTATPYSGPGGTGTPGLASSVTITIT